MKDNIAYSQLINNLQDPSDPLFGGSLAYLTIEQNLSMVIKLMKIKLKKPSDKSSFYEKTILLCSSIIPFSHLMITKDGEIFGMLRKEEDPSKKDQIIEDIFPRSLAFLSNLCLISDFLDELIIDTTSSIKNDYIMIKDNVNSCFYNLASILAFEVKKLSKEDRKLELDEKIETLVMNQRAKELKGE